MSNTSMPANFLNRTALPSITGLPARGPILPRPSTAVPLETTATRLARAVSSAACGRVRDDRLAGGRHAGRIGEREVALVAERLGRLDLQLSGLRRAVIDERTQRAGRRICRGHCHTPVSVRTIWHFIRATIGYRSAIDEDPARTDRRHRDRGGRLFRLRVLCAAADRKRGRGGVRAAARERRQGELRQGLVRPLEPHHHGRRHRGRIRREAAARGEDRPVRRSGRQPAGGWPVCRGAHRDRGGRGQRKSRGPGRGELFLQGPAGRSRRATRARPARCAGSIPPPRGRSTDSHSSISPR